MPQKKSRTTAEIMDLQCAQAVAQIFLASKEMFLRESFPDHRTNVIPIIPEFCTYVGLRAQNKPMTATDLAQAASLNRKSVDRFLLNLIDRKLIERDGKLYEVADRDVDFGARLESLNKIEAAAMTVLAAIRNLKQVEVEKQQGETGK